MANRIGASSLDIEARLCVCLASASLGDKASAVVRVWPVVGVVGMVLCLGSCGRGWMQITEVGAASPSSSVLTGGIDGCASLVATSSRAIRRYTCSSAWLQRRRRGGVPRGFQVRLAQPIGSRKVIDDRRHVTLPVTFGVQIAMPVPSWLPVGWALIDEGGSEGLSASTYAKAAWRTVGHRGSDVVHRWALNNFVARHPREPTTIQGRPAIWVHSIQQPSASALVLHDDHWTLVVQDSDSTVGHDVVERIADSLTPPPPPCFICGPAVPGAWVGTVTEVSGKYGRAVVTGWLIIDSSGSASTCDDLAGRRNGVFRSNVRQDGLVHAGQGVSTKASSPGETQSSALR